MNSMTRIMVAHTKHIQTSINKKNCGSHKFSPNQVRFMVVTFIKYIPDV